MTTLPYERRTAMFRPLHTDDLVTGAEGWIGAEGVWQAGWVIEDGPYAGEWAWMFVRVDPDNEPPPPPFAWVPGCDLEFGELVVHPGIGGPDA